MRKSFEWTSSPMFKNKEMRQPNVNERDTTKTTVRSSFSFASFMLFFLRLANTVLMLFTRILYIHVLSFAFVYREKENERAVWVFAQKL